MKVKSAFVWSSVEWVVRGGAASCPLRSQNLACGLMLKKLMPLVIELVVILNHLGVKHL